MLGYSASTILDIGPSYDQYIESASAHGDWSKVLVRKYSGKDFEDLCEVEDEFYKRTMSFERADLDRVSGSEPYEAVVYNVDRYDDNSYRRARKYFDQRAPEAPHRPRTSASPV